MNRTTKKIFLIGVLTIIVFIIMGIAEYRMVNEFTTTTTNELRAIKEQNKAIKSQNKAIQNELNHLKQQAFINRIRKK